MRRRLLSAFSWSLLLLSVLPVYAGWTPVEGNEKSYDYVDLATLRSDGALRRVVTLHDLVERDADGDMSYRNHLEFNCSDGRLRSLQSVFYAGSMGTGRITARSDGPSPWRDAAAGSVGATVMKLACSRR